MIAGDASEIIVALIQSLSEARTDRDTWRLIAVQTLHHAHALHVEAERLRKAYHRVLDERRQDRQRPAA